MEFAAAGESGGRPLPVTIRRLTAEGIPWRVRAEVWSEEAGQFAGRITFEPDQERASVPVRTGPTSLRGGSQAEVIAEAHQLSERRLRAMLHALG